jgi:hypothetical protein
MKTSHTASLLTIALLGVVALPAMADTAVIQDNSQDVYVDGVNNAADQLNEQMSWSQRVNVQGQDGSVGVVQKSVHMGTILGKDNTTYQHNSQVNVTESMHRNRRPIQAQDVPITIYQN